MTTNDVLGAVSRDGESHATIRFERRLGAPIGEVWAALTSPDQLERWMAETTVDLRVGGAIRHSFGSGEANFAEGSILVLDAPHVLEYEWRFPGESDSIVRYELIEETTSSTLLKLSHRLIGIDHAPGYGAGWHAYLDRLVALIALVDRADLPSWDDRFGELRARYQLS